jgi:prepilin signal peptidase PulO-like enzyme (type II secretory pathway)
MTYILSIVGILVTLFIAVIASTLIGGVVGWTVNLMFPVVNQTLNQLSGLQLDAFDMGAVLGFFGSFFRSTLQSK